MYYGTTKVASKEDLLYCSAPSLDHYLQIAHARGPDVSHDTDRPGKHKIAEFRLNHFAMLQLREHGDRKTICCFRSLQPRTSPRFSQQS